MEACPDAVVMSDLQGQILFASPQARKLLGLAYEIHDGLAQDLAAAIMQFQADEHFKKQKRATAQTAYDAGRELLQQAYFEARRLISGVRPPILDESGLVAALEHLLDDQWNATMIGLLIHLPLDDYSPFTIHHPLFRSVYPLVCLTW